MGRAHPFTPGFTGWGGHIQAFSRQPGPGKMSEFSGSGLSGLGNIDCRWHNRGLFIFYVLQNWNHNTSWLVPVFFRFGVSIPALQFLFVKSIFLCCLAFACPRVAGWLGKGKEIQISRFNPKASGGPRPSRLQLTTALPGFEASTPTQKNSNQNSPQWTLAR